MVYEGRGRRGRGGELGREGGGGGGEGDGRSGRHRGAARRPPGGRPRWPPASARLACVCESAAPPARVRVRVGMGEDEQGRGNLVNCLSLLFLLFFSRFYSAEHGRHPN
jgi:hypothetical protein